MINVKQASAVRRKGHVFIGAAIGHLIEWYDYGVYGFLAAYVGQEFFVSSDPMNSLLGGFAAFALSFFARPLGGLIFGPLADRAGRRSTLIVVLTIMAGSTAAVGILPSYRTAGVLAPILLIVVRCIQGLSAGGEIGTVTSFISEYAGPKRRGFSTSWLMVTAVLGLLVGGAVANGMTYLFGAAFMQNGGWRIPFLMAAPMGVISLYIRLKLEDSPEFLSLVNSGTIAQAPLREVLRWKRAISLVFFIIALHAAIFYLLLTFASTFMSKLLKFDNGTTLLYTTASALIAAMVMPLGGILTDRYGRRPFLLVIAVLATLSMWWFFVAAPGAAPTSFLMPLVSVAVTFGLYASSTYATMSELLPTRIRATGIAIAYNLPVALFGGCAPLISTWLIRETGQLSSPRYFFVFTGMVSIAALYLLRKRDFVQEAGAVAPTQPDKVATLAGVAQLGGS